MWHTFSTDFIQNANLILSIQSVQAFYFLNLEEARNIKVDSFRFVQAMVEGPKILTKNSRKSFLDIKFQSYKVKNLYCIPENVSQPPDWRKGAPPKFFRALIPYLSDRDLASTSTVCRRWNFFTRVKLKQKAKIYRETKELDRKLREEIENAEQIVIRYIRKDPSTLTRKQADDLLKSRLILQRENMFDIGMFLKKL